jgi:hypothetical protein
MSWSNAALSLPMQKTLALVNAFVISCVARVLHGDGLPCGMALCRAGRWGAGHSPACVSLPPGSDHVPWRAGPAWFQAHCLHSLARVCAHARARAHTVYITIAGFVGLKGRSAAWACLALCTRWGGAREETGLSLFGSRVPGAGQVLPGVQLPFPYHAHAQVDALAG